MNQHLRLILEKLSNKVLLDVLKNFLEAVKKEKSNVREALKSLKYKPTGGKHAEFGVDTLMRKVSKIEKNPNAPHKKERVYIIDCITISCNTWHFDYNEQEHKFSSLPVDVRQYHFAAYYWGAEREVKSNKKNSKDDSEETKINVCHLHFIIHGDQQCRAEMQLYMPKNKKGINDNFSTLKSTEFIPAFGNFFIDLQDEAEPKLHSQLIIAANISDLHERQVLLGTFSTVNKSTSQLHRPMAGVICLIKKENERDVINLYNDLPQSIPDEIYDLLFRSSLIVDDTKVYSKIEELSTYKEITDLKAFSGNYLCNIINKTKSGNYLETILLKIYTNTSAEMYLIDSTKQAGIKVYKGRIRSTEDRHGLLIGYFDYQPKTKVNRFTLYINNIWKNDNDTLYGVYAGIDGQFDNIVAGCIRLIKLPEENIDSLLHKVNKQLITDAAIKGMDEDLKWLFSRSDHPEDYIESLRLSNGVSGENGSSKKPFPVVGTFFLYSLSSDHDSILKYPLTIDANGTACLISDTDNIPRIGQAYYDHFKVLSLQIAQKKDEEKISYYLFFVGQVTDFNHVFGVSGKLTRATGRLAAKLEILVRAEHPDKPTMESLRIDRESFMEEDRKMKGLLCWLTGMLNRTIIAPRTNDRFYPVGRVKDKEEYVDIHFYAACYLAREGNREEEKKEEALRHLYQAYLHGFADVSLIEKETKEDGALYQLLKTKELKVRPRFNEHIEKLNCQGIIDKINARIDHLRGITD